MRLAIYPGSFDPPTNGHLDVLERAVRLFDKVIVGIGVNSAKLAPFLTIPERVAALRACTSHLGEIDIRPFEGLLIQAAQEWGAGAIVRGLRATSDFDYEFQIAMANRRLDERIETVFLMTKWEHSYLSSSIVREVARLGGDFSTFVPPEVSPFIEKRLKT